MTVAMLGAVGCWREPVAPGFPAKILLVSIDTTRADHVSAYGYRHATTPFLDSLSRRGVRFVTAYAPMPTTDPSHATILTGQYPRTHGIVQNADRRSDPAAPSLGSWLKRRGYTTAAITARLGLDPGKRGIRGFDHRDAPRLPRRWRGAPEIVKRVQRWLARRRAEERWFLLVHLWEPHKPYAPKAKYRGRFLDRQIDPSLIDEDPPRFVGTEDLVEEGTVAAAASLYDGEIAAADDAVQAVIAYAERAEPTGVVPLIMIVSDHGESLAERQRETGIAFGHGALIYDEVLRVPWLTVWEGVLAPAIIETAVSLVDLAPTLIGLIASEDMLAGVEGRDLAPYLRSGAEPPPRPLVVERRPFATMPIGRLRHPEAAWIEHPWKLIVNDGISTPELYRLDTDPGERRNLVAFEEARAGRMAAALARWKDERPVRGRRGLPMRRRAAELEALRSLGYIE